MPEDCRMLHKRAHTRYSHLRARKKVPFSCCVIRAHSYASIGLSHIHFNLMKSFTSPIPFSFCSQIFRSVSLNLSTSLLFFGAVLVARLQHMHTTYFQIIHRIEAQYFLVTALTCLIKLTYWENQVQPRDFNFYFHFGVFVGAAVVCCCCLSSLNFVALP